MLIFVPQVVKEAFIEYDEESGQGRFAVES